MIKQFTEKEIDERAQQLVQNEVIMCATWLMDALREYSENHSDDAIFDMDQYYSGSAERCPHCGNTDWDSVDEARKRDFNFDPEFEVEGEYICADCMKTFDEPYTPEIYEYWFVSNWFADELRKKGECILDTCWNPIWGRCTTGQAIYIDGVVHEIARELLEFMESLKKK